MWPPMKLFQVPPAVSDLSFQGSQPCFHPLIVRLVVWKSSDWVEMCEATVSGRVWSYEFRPLLYQSYLKDLVNISQSLPMSFPHLQKQENNGLWCKLPLQWMHWWDHWLVLTGSIIPSTPIAIKGFWFPNGHLLNRWISLEESRGANCVLIGVCHSPAQLLPSQQKFEGLTSPLPVGIFSSSPQSLLPEGCHLVSEEQVTIASGHLWAHPVPVGE